MSKVAPITGITGQDGSYLAELLLAKGYQVHGAVRRASTINTSRIEPGWYPTTTFSELTREMAQADWTAVCHATH